MHEGIKTGHIVWWGKATDGTGKTLLSPSPGENHLILSIILFSLHYRVRKEGQWGFESGQKSINSPNKKF